MKRHIFRSYLTLPLMMLFALSAVSVESQAGIFPLFKKKKKTAKTEVKKSNYEKALTDRPITSARSSFLSLHKTDEKLLIDIPKSSLGRDILLGATVTSASNPQLGKVGFKNSNLIHIRFIQKDSSIIMQVVNTPPLSPTNNKSKTEKANANYGDLDFYKFPIKAYSKRDSSILFDASSFFLKEDRFFPVVQWSVGSFSVSPRINDAATRITSLKAFDTNASIVQERSYTVDINGKGGAKGLSNYPLTLGLNFTMALLPKEPMKPRLSDSRLGVFLNQIKREKDGKLEDAFVMRRWRVEPKDTAAFNRGELSDPIKPIVFYVENTFPLKWKDAIKKGILRWNKAFERIGFKNVMQVRDFPTDDPSFDPDNFAYSCIRYLPMAIENAMGPSWVDPRSGEIVNASVLVYNDIINVINNWRFVQTAQLDPEARKSQLSDSLVFESLEYVIAHEIGHTLGFMHNMAASAALPVDSLRSPQFTRQHGTTSSIMDYARYNYVAQPEDKGVALTPPFLGVYDYFMVDQTYRYFPDSKGYEDDYERLCKRFEEHAGDPFYRYGVQQIEHRYDPSAVEEDLSNDPVKASDYGMKNLRYILSHLDSWIDDEDNAKRKRELYEEILSQAMGYVRNVFANVSGIYLYQTSETSGLPRYKVVPREEQKASAQWLLKQARTFSTLSNEEIERKLPAAGNRPFRLVERDVQALSMLSSSKLFLSHYLDSTSYSPMEYLEDVYQDIFGKTITQNESLTKADLSMQQLFVRLMTASVQEAGQTGGLRSLRQSTTHHHHETALQPCECSLHRKQNQPTAEEVAFGNGYGMPNDLWGQSITRVTEYHLFYAQKVKELLEGAVKKTANEELKAHYALLLAKLKQHME
ncbi:MAG: zinc-dependent metalloprotease [Prevotella sp.]|nr:zinc-dependent metalloprotease [Prevotella sp.]